MPVSVRNPSATFISKTKDRKKSQPTKISLLELFFLLCMFAFYLYMFIDLNPGLIFKMPFLSSWLSGNPLRYLSESFAKIGTYLAPSFASKFSGFFAGMSAISPAVWIAICLVGVLTALYFIMCKPNQDRLLHGSLSRALCQQSPEERLESDYPILDLYDYKPNIRLATAAASNDDSCSSTPIIGISINDPKQEALLGNPTLLQHLKARHRSRFRVLSLHQDPKKTVKIIQAIHKSQHILILPVIAVRQAKSLQNYLAKPEALPANPEQFLNKIPVEWSAFLSGIVQSTSKLGYLHVGKDTDPTQLLLFLDIAYQYRRLMQSALKTDSNNGDLSPANFGIALYLSSALSRSHPIIDGLLKHSKRYRLFCGINAKYHQNLDISELTQQGFPYHIDHNTKQVDVPAFSYIQLDQDPVMLTSQNCHFWEYLLQDSRCIISNHKTLLTLSGGNIANATNSVDIMDMLKNKNQILAHVDASTMLPHAAGSVIPLQEQSGLISGLDEHKTGMLIWDFQRVDHASMPSLLSILLKQNQDIDLHWHPEVFKLLAEQYVSQLDKDCSAPTITLHLPKGDYSEFATLLLNLLRTPWVQIHSYDSEDLATIIDAHIQEKSTPNNLHSLPSILQDRITVHLDESNKHVYTVLSSEQQKHCIISTNLNALDLVKAMSDATTTSPSGEPQTILLRENCTTPINDQPINPAGYRLLIQHKTSFKDMATLSSTGIANVPIPITIANYTRIEKRSRCFDNAVVPLLQRANVSLDFSTFDDSNTKYWFAKLDEYYLREHDQPQPLLSIHLEYSQLQYLQATSGLTARIGIMLPSRIPSLEEIQILNNMQTPAALIIEDIRIVGTLAGDISRYDYNSRGLLKITATNAVICHAQVDHIIDHPAIQWHIMPTHTTVKTFKKLLLCSRYRPLAFSLASAKTIQLYRDVCIDDDTESVANLFKIPKHIHFMPSVNPCDMPRCDHQPLSSTLEPIPIVCLSSQQLETMLAANADQCDLWQIPQRFFQLGEEGSEPDHRQTYSMLTYLYAFCQFHNWHCTLQMTAPVLQSLLESSECAQMMRNLSPHISLSFTRNAREFLSEKSQQDRSAHALAEPQLKTLADILQPGAMQPCMSIHHGSFSDSTIAAYTMLYPGMFAIDVMTCSLDRVSNLVQHLPPGLESVPITFMLHYLLESTRTVAHRLEILCDRCKHFIDATPITDAIVLPVIAPKQFPYTADKMLVLSSWQSRHIDYTVQRLARSCHHNTILCPVVYADPPVPIFTGEPPYHSSQSFVDMLDLPSEAMLSVLQSAFMATPCQASDKIFFDIAASDPVQFYNDDPGIAPTAVGQYRLNPNTIIDTINGHVLLYISPNACPYKLEQFLCTVAPSVRFCLLSYPSSWDANQPGEWLSSKKWQHYWQNSTANCQLVLSLNLSLRFSSAGQRQAHHYLGLRNQDPVVLKKIYQYCKHTNHVIDFFIGKIVNTGSDGDSRVTISCPYICSTATTTAAIPEVVHDFTTLFLRILFRSGDQLASSQEITMKMRSELCTLDLFDPYNDTNRPTSSPYYFTDIYPSSGYFTLSSLSCLFADMEWTEREKIAGKYTLINLNAATRLCTLSSEERSLLTGYIISNRLCFHLADNDALYPLKEIARNIDAPLPIACADVTYIPADTMTRLVVGAAELSHYSRILTGLPAESMPALPSSIHIEATDRILEGRDHRIDNKPTYLANLHTTLQKLIQCGKSDNIAISLTFSIPTQTSTLSLVLAPSFIIEYIRFVYSSALTDVAITISHDLEDLNGMQTHTFCLENNNTLLLPFSFLNHYKDTIFQHTAPLFAEYENDMETTMLGTIILSWIQAATNNAQEDIQRYVCTSEIVEKIYRETVTFLSLADSTPMSAHPPVHMSLASILDQLYASAGMAAAAPLTPISISLNRDDLLRWLKTQLTGTNTNTDLLTQQRQYWQKIAYMTLSLVSNQRQDRSLTPQGLYQLAYVFYIMPVSRNSCEFFINFFTTIQDVPSTQAEQLTQTFLQIIALMAKEFLDECTELQQRELLNRIETYYLSLETTRLTPTINTLQHASSFRDFKNTPSSAGSEDVGAAASADRQSASDLVKSDSTLAELIVAGYNPIELQSSGITIEDSTNLPINQHVARLSSQHLVNCIDRKQVGLIEMLIQCALNPPKNCPSPEKLLRYLQAHWAVETVTKEISRFCANLYNPNESTETAVAFWVNAKIHCRYFNDHSPVELQLPNTFRYESAAENLSDIQRVCRKLESMSMVEYASIYDIYSQRPDLFGSQPILEYLTGFLFPGGKTIENWTPLVATTPETLLKESWEYASAKYLQMLEVIKGAGDDAYTKVHKAYIKAYENDESPQSEDTQLKARAVELFSAQLPRSFPYIATFDDYVMPIKEPNETDDQWQRRNQLVSALLSILFHQGLELMCQYARDIPQLSDAESADDFLSALQNTSFSRRYQTFLGEFTMALHLHSPYANNVNRLFPPLNTTGRMAIDTADILNVLKIAERIECSTKASSSVCLAEDSPHHLSTGGLFSAPSSAENHLAAAAAEEAEAEAAPSTNRRG